MEAELIIPPNEEDFSAWDKSPADTTKAVQRYAEEVRETMAARTIVHVENGKPKTAIGAKLLGVPWRGE
jgi:hypothetical protein